MPYFIEILKAILFGIVEGITEWLPVSSTGHLILIEEFINLNVTPEFLSMFFVVIQLGAIAAVPVLFWRKLVPLGTSSANGSNKQERSSLSNESINPTPSQIGKLWLKVIVGVIPAAVIGFFLDDIIEEYLMGGEYSFIIVAAALVIYGIAFILIEYFRRGRKARIESVYDLTYKDALVIGAFQVLSLVPGTSRSGSTILGGILTGVSRTAASEFSFFMAIPVMLGASLLKVVKFFFDGIAISGFEFAILGIAILVSFLVSVVAIKFLMNFVSKHSFAPFGVYRIVLGVILILYFVLKVAGVIVA